MPGKRLFGPAYDLIRRARAALRVRRLELRGRRLAAGRDGMVITGAVEQGAPILYVNHAFELAYGYPAEEVLGRNCRFLQAGDRDQPVLDELRAALREGREFTGVVRNYHRDGRLIYNELSIFPVRGAKGRPTSFIGVQNDVTGRVRAEERLRESERRLRALLARHGSEMITILDPDGTPRYESPTVRGALGYDHMRAAGGDPFQNIHPDDVAKLSGAVAGCLYTPGESPPVEFRIRRADGAWRHFESVANNLADDPEIRGIVVSTRDVTARKQAEEALRTSEAYFRRVVETLGEGLIVTDAEDLVLDVNSCMTRLAGYTREEMLGRPAYELLLPPEEQGSMFERNSERLRRGGHETYERRLRRKDGSWFWADISAAPYRDSAGELAGTLGTVTDISRRKQAERARRESEGRFRQLFEHSVDALFVHDAEGRIRDVNPEACRSLGYSRRELLSMRVADLTDDLISPEERARKEQDGGTLWQRVVSGGPQSRPAVHVGFHRRKDGATFPIEVRLGGVDYGGERMILASARDITERRELEAQLEYLAFHDELTGLPNRAYFMDRLEQALTRAGRSGNGVAVLFLDLDDFKLVNDSLGHSMGDLLLSAVARRLEACLRPDDVAARFGGDEFTILLEDALRVENATVVAERLAGCLSPPVVLGREEVFVRVSIGIAFSDSGRNDPEALMRDADATMYRAKAGGKGHYEVSDPRMNLRAMQCLQRENDLRRAVESPEESFVVHYQPKVSVATGEITGMEALVRWRLPGGELVYPDSFIPLAEETGLIVPIGKKVLRDACIWLREHGGRDGPPLNVSVNLSARQFREPDLVRQVARILEETGADPESLVLEITESVVLEHGEVFEKLGQLKTPGTKIHLDDFGTGYSSLSYLKHLPVDAVKIDKTFIDGLGGSREDAVLVSAIINLVRALGLDVVAEGVQTSAQLALLRELECPQAQGSLFSGPLPAHEAADLLAPRG